MANKGPRDKRKLTGEHTPYRFALPPSLLRRSKGMPGKVLGGRIFNRELNLVCATRYPWGCGDSIIGLSKLRGEDAARPVSSRSVSISRGTIR